MFTALIAGSLVAGGLWCWAKLVAPWVRAQGLHEELLEMQREFVVPPKGGESRYAEGLANLAAMTSGQGVSDALDSMPTYKMTNALAEDPVGKRV
uniref:Uncharacterized protein n=1 Tax=Solibacter usitatus (strain Ellin6076) TaxID=234267 RepID=Q01XI1_SOLUE